MELWDILDKDGNATYRTHERGKPMERGEYHLIVHVWILNSAGELLITKRSDTGWWSGLWQTTGGAAVAGEDSLSAAFRETAEETGINLDKSSGRLFKRYSEPHKNDAGSVFIDAWLFHADFDIREVVLQPGETCDAMWATPEKIKRMMKEGSFLRTTEAYRYIDELFGCIMASAS